MPELSRKLLNPIVRNGPFDEAYVASRVVARSPGAVPRIIVICGTCRSGSTAMFWAFSKVMTSFFQPLKSILRSGRNILLLPDEECIAIKESLGPFHIAECEMNPVQILLKAGVPPSRLALISLIREPAESCDSWFDHFADTNLQLFKRALERVEEITLETHALGIRTCVLAHESLNGSREPVMLDLFRKLNLQYSPAVCDWRMEAHGRAVMDPEPGYKSAAFECYRERIFEKVIGREGLAYRKRRLQHLSQQELKYIREHCEPIYRRLYATHQQQFQSVAPRALGTGEPPSIQL